MPILTNVLGQKSRSRESREIKVASTGQPIGCRAKRTATYTLSFGTWWNFTPQTDSATGCFDTAGMWETGWDYIKITKAGIYTVGANISASTSVSSGSWEIKLLLNTTQIGFHWTTRHGYDASTPIAVAEFAVNDKFYVQIANQSGSGTPTLSADCAMFAIRHN